MVDRARSSLALMTKAKSEMNLSGISNNGHMTTTTIDNNMLLSGISTTTTTSRVGVFVRSESSLDSYNDVVDRGAGLIGESSASMRAATSAATNMTGNLNDYEDHRISESFLNSLNDAALSSSQMVKSTTGVSAGRRMSASSSMSSQSASMIATITNPTHHRARHMSKSGKKKKSKSKKEKLDTMSAGGGSFNIPCSQLLHDHHDESLLLMVNGEDNYDKIKQQLLTIDMVDVRKLYKLKPEYQLDESGEETGLLIDEWSADPVAIKTTSHQHHHHSNNNIGVKSALSKSKSLTAKSSSVKHHHHIQSSSSMFRCFKDPQAYLSYYKAEKFAKVLSSSNTRNGGGHTTMNESNNAVGSIVNLTPNSVHAVLNQSSIQQSNQDHNHSSFSSLPQLSPPQQPHTPPSVAAAAATPPHTLQRAVTNIGFKMIDPSINNNKLNGGSFQSGGASSSDALLQKLIPYTTTQGGNNNMSIRAAGGGTMRVSPKAYRSRYQYQFARNLIAKIITTNQQNAKTLLKKNEKYLNNAIAQQQQQNSFLNSNNNNNSYQNMDAILKDNPVGSSNNTTTSGGDYSFYSITNLDNNQSISILENDELNASSCNSHSNLTAKVVQKPGKRVIEFYNRSGEENSNNNINPTSNNNLGRVMSIRRPRLPPRTNSNIDMTTTTNHLGQTQQPLQQIQLNSVLSSKNLNTPPTTRENNSRGRTNTPPHDIQLLSVGTTVSTSLAQQQQQSRSMLGSREYTTVSRGSSISTTTPGGVVKRDQSLAAVRARLAASAASAKNLATAAANNNNNNNNNHHQQIANNNKKQLLGGVVNNYTVKFQV